MKAVHRSEGGGVVLNSANLFAVMKKKQLVIISGYCPKESMSYITRLYINYDEVNARTEFEADGGSVTLCQSLGEADVIEWQTTLTGVQYKTYLTRN